MNRDSLGYLTNNSDVTYFADGSIAKALIEATNLEISKLQEFINIQYENSFLSTASGIYLDLFGEMLGVPRILENQAAVGVEDGAIRFYVESGTLASRLADVSNSAQGLIPAGTRVSNLEGTVEFTVPVPIPFPRNARSVVVPAIASEKGKGFNVGVNQLTRHNLHSEVKVTNDLAITTGTDVEEDGEYRFRLSRAMTARFGTNETAVHLAALSHPGVLAADLLEFSRGAGTFDVLLVPKGNRVAQSTLDEVRRTVERTTAFGISSRVREPVYVAFQIIVQLRFKKSASAGASSAAKARVQTAILDYFGNIPLGGDIVINRIRSRVITSHEQIQDLRIIELCLDGRPRTIRNHRLNPDELLIPDSKSVDPVMVV